MRSIIPILVAIGVGCGGPRPRSAENLAAPRCPAQIDTTPVDGTVFPTWLAAWTELAGTAASTTTEEQAQILLCSRNGCRDEGPSIITVGDRYYFAVPVREGLLVFADLGVAVTTPCAFAPYIEIAAGVPVRVTMTDVILDDHGGSTEACVLAGAGYTDAFFDIVARRRVLSIDRARVRKDPSNAKPGSDDWRDPIEVTAVPGGVRVSGAGCDQTIPFPR